MATTASLQCPHCRKPLPASPQFRCPACNGDIRGAFIRRAAPAETGRLESLYRKYPWYATLIVAPCLLGFAWFQYDNIATAERYHTSFSVNAFTSLLYDVGGKWGVAGVYAALGLFALWLSFKSFQLQRGKARS